MIEKLVFLLFLGLDAVARASQENLSKSASAFLFRARQIESHSISVAAAIRLRAPSAYRQMITSPIVNLVTDCNGDATGNGYNDLAIASCLSKLQGLGGTLYIPQGKFLASPFNITSANNQMTLLLDPQATLIATTDVTRWPIILPLPSLNSSREYLVPSRYSAFITLLGANGIRITSNVTKMGQQGGSFDGNGPTWWALRESKKLERDPGGVIETYDAENIEIDSVSVQWSPYWHVHPYASSFVYIHDTYVSSLHSGPETDGIDPDCSHDVLLERVTIDTGDDAISVKSGWDAPGILFGHPSYNIVVNDSYLSTGANAFCMGSEMSGGVYNVTAHNVSCVDVDSCFRLKSSLGRGGVISDIYMYNSSSLGAKTAIEASDFYGGHPGPIDPSLIPSVGNSGVIGFKGVFTESAGNFQGLSNSNISNFLMIDIDLDAGENTWSCINVTGKASNVKPLPCKNFVITTTTDVNVGEASTAPLPCGAPTILGFYTPQCDANGLLLPPPGGVQGAVDHSVQYYALSPRDLPLAHGFPPFVWATFTAGDYIPTSLDIIAGMQDGMGLIGYLKYYARAKAGRGGNATAALDAAIFLGDYLSLWSLTPSQGVWSNVTRSTGINLEWPLFSSSQGDANFGINCIETDRVGMTGYALLKLYEVVPNSRYLTQAIHSARVLAATQVDGNATDAPWPFRVDAVTGAFLNGHKNGESAFPLRLFRALAAPPYSLSEFIQPANRLWAWVRDFQLPTARANVTPAESLFVNFFEDRTTALDNNRNSWTALELARLLIDEREALDPDWMAHVEDIFSYTLALFGHPTNIGNATIMGEQDDDNKPWGGANSKLGGVASKYGCAGGPAFFSEIGKLNAYHIAYFTDPTDGCRSANAYDVNVAPTRGGWTEDAWLDVLHNLVDHLEAVDGIC